MKITAVDDYFPDTGGLYAFYDASDDPAKMPLGQGFFCRSVEGVTIPAGAARLVIAVNTLVNMTSLECNSVSPPTTGTISIEISD